MRRWSISKSFRTLMPSCAGVPRRTTARAVGVGAVAGAALAAPVVLAPACYQIADAYGGAYVQCS